MTGVRTDSEFTKLLYLQGVYDAVYDTRQAWATEREQLDVIEAADLAGWHFDWETVIRHIQPEIQLVMSGDRRVENRHPVYACFPRNGDWITLRPGQVHKSETQQEGNPSLSDTFERGADAVRTAILQLPDDRRDTAMKHLRSLIRIARPAL